MGISDSSSGDVVALLDKLENKIIMLIAAAVLGVGGNQALQTVKPTVVRPDPFTGAMAQQMETRLVNLINEAEEHSEHRHNLQAEALTSLEKRQALDDQHRIEAARGWKFIYEMREDIAAMKADLQHAKQLLDELRIQHLEKK